jgi:hypothetical protein
MLYHAKGNQPIPSTRAFLEAPSVIVCGLMILRIWLLSIAHGCLFIIITPLWEGFDEPFHYAYIQHIAEYGTLPAFGKSLISREVTTSFRLAPVSTAVNANLGNRYTSFPDYWSLPENVRKERETSLRSISPALRALTDDSEAACMNYEAQHPPLYYFLCAGIYRMFSHYDLPALVFVLRLFSMLVGSLTVFIAYAIARQMHLPCGNFYLPLMIALLPMFISTVARISNDSLGVALFSGVILCVFNYVRSEGAGKYALYAGITLGLGLLTKAYFLTAFPAIAIIFLTTGLKRSNFRRSLNHLLLLLAACFLIAGWWYIRNYIMYGTISGLFVLSSARPVSFSGYVKNLFLLPWTKAIDIIFRQQLWIGNSSFFSLSKLFYRFAYFLGLLAFLGIAKTYVIRIMKRNESGPSGRMGTLDIMLGFYLFFVLGLMYQLFATFAITGQITTGGWYLYAVVIPAVFLLYYGLDALLLTGMKKHVSTILISFVLLMNLIGYFCKAFPYYAGFIISRFHFNHFLDLYSPANIITLLQRLSLNKPAFITPAGIGICITAYLSLVVLVCKNRNPGD